MAPALMHCHAEAAKRAAENAASERDLDSGEPVVVDAKHLVAVLPELLLDM